MSFYKMHRGWMESDVFAKEPFTECQAWEWMISEAAWEPRQINLAGQPVQLHRGQFSHSLRYMAATFKWTLSKTRVFIDKLKRFENCSIAPATANRTAQHIITICNYSQYQDKPTASDIASDTQSSTATAQQQHNNKELKKIKKKEEDLGAACADLITPEIKPEKKRGGRLKAYLDEIGEDAVGREFGTWALQELGLDVGTINAEMAKFCDYWNATPGQKGVKLDWPATWRNWCRSAKEKQTKEANQREIWARKRT